jgi:helicase
MGDAYILVPESKMRIYTQKYSAPRRIESQLLEKTGSQHKSLAFHLVSEIFFGGISTTDDFHNWYKRSLAHYQNKQLHGTVVDDTLELLRKCGAIGQEDGKWTARSIGKISSMFYISPFDVSDLYFGFKNLFDSKREEDDYALSITIANLDSQRMNIVSKAEKDEISLYANKIRVMMAGKFLTDGCIKAGYCYFNLLTGNNSQVLAAFQRNLQQDYNRISQVLQAMDTMTGQWDRSGWFKTLEARIASGVPAHLIDLCKIANIGKVRATKLYDAGYKTSKDLAKLDAAKLSKLINVKLDMAQEMLQSAKGKSIDFFEA